MENHPIPQDVTGFKFKLIGSVTVKQFLYILGGGILAVVVFILPINILIRLPLSLFFGAIGAALAFIPIEGRPMDIMIKNFLKALPSENQYIYRKKGNEALITALFVPAKVAAPQQTKKDTSEQDSRRALLYKTLKSSSGYVPDANEKSALSTINTYFDTPQSASPPHQKVDTEPVKPVEEPAREELQVVKPAPAPKEEIIAKPTPPIQQPEKVAAPTPPPAPPPAGVAPNESQSVNSVAPEAQLKAGFPQLPDAPNVVLGIVKDPRGKVIPNILVEIMDKQGVPVRAFKTNALGQFKAATPLPNGEYTVVLEDQRKQNEFENINIALDGSIFQPLEIFSVDQREKLRRELFDNNQTRPTA